MIPGGPMVSVTTPEGQRAAFGLAGLRHRPLVRGNAVLVVPVEGLGWWLRQVGRALSRVLNALAGGEGDTTYSAGSWAAKLAGTRWGATRVRIVDWLNQEPGHCAAAFAWHRDHGLLAEDSPG